MIQSVTLENFKTYTNQTFTFHSGINIFVGSSNNGKSQIFRALYWVINNRPMGKSVVSYWNRDNKGDPIHPTKVILQADDKAVIRLRESGKNCYLFDDKTFEALKGTVPEEITAFLNMTDINIQHQKEQPFLISFTPGEAAKYLNAIIKLDVIDECLTSVKQKKTKCENALKTESAELETLQNELTSLNWVEDAEILLEKIEGINKERIEKESALSRLNESISSYQELKNRIEQFINIESAEKLISEVREIEKELVEKRNQYRLLSDSIERYSDSKRKLEKSVCVDEAECIIQDIKQIDAVIRENREKESALNEQISNYEYAKDQLVLIEKELVELNNKLPATCPICGGKLKKE